MKKQFGIYMGRFQPFHLGHQSVVSEIIADGLIPIIVLGSCNVHNAKNPLTNIRRMDIIRSVYPHMIIKLTDDNYDSWDNWLDGVEKQLDGYKEVSTIYIHKKEEDKINFTCRGKEYIDANYQDVFVDNGFDVKDVSLSPYNLINTRASKIRADLQGNKQYLDGRVFRILKELGYKDKIEFNEKENT